MHPDFSIIGNYPVLVDGHTVQIPVLDVRWHDERTGCRLAHAHLAGHITAVEAEASLETCSFYQRAPIGAGRCTMNGKVTGEGRNPCLFHQNPHSADWQNVMRWRMIEQPDGALALCRAQDAAAIAADLGAVVWGQITVLAPAAPPPAHAYYEAAL